MTIEEKARRYDESLGRARNLHKDAIDMDENIRAKQCEIIFPELKESDDEKNIKNLIDELKCSLRAANCQNEACGGGHEKRIALLEWAIAWLEKQGEQMPADKVVPKFNVGNTITYIGERKELVADNKYTIKEICKNCYISTRGNKIPFSMQEYYTIVNDAKFKVGDWIISKYMHLVMQILNNDNGFYATIETDGTERNDNYDFIERNFKLWSIADAKDGDVLAYVTDEEDLWIMIYWSLYEPYEGHVHYHALLVNDNFSDKGTCCICINDLKPATKEQRDILFSKMKEEGYEWDAEKKEVKKIEQKPTQEIEPFEAEHGKWYYCIKDYFCGGRKQASKGDVVQALRGLPIMGLKDVSEYFLPLNSIKCNSFWSEEDEDNLDCCIGALKSHFGEQSDEFINWIKSLKERMGG